MALPRFGAPILLGVVTVLALVLITGGLSEDETELRETLRVGATYDSGVVEITYSDSTGKTRAVVLEILGMEESFQRTVASSEFTERVDFPAVSAFGWAVNPVVFDVDHEEFGRVEIKTEIRPEGEEPAPVIYSKR